MKVFISSVIAGYEDRRAAAEEAVRDLGHEVLRAEDFGARTSSPRAACLAGVRASDLVVLILGQRYGGTLPSGISATHEEFREAQQSREVLAFVEQTEREPEQTGFVEEVQEWEGGVFTEPFETLRELRAKVTRAIHKKTLEQAQGGIDPAALALRSLSLLPENERGWGGRILLHGAIATGPHQTILRPREIESSSLADRIFKIALHSKNAIFDRREGTETEIKDGALVLRQPTSVISVHPDASMTAAVSPDLGEMRAALIEESVQAGLTRLIGMFDEVLSEIDKTGRVRMVCLATSVVGADHLGWRTAKEETLSPRHVQMGSGFREQRPVQLHPPVFPRALLRTRGSDLADDLMVLLRRQFR